MNRRRRINIIMQKGPPQTPENRNRDTKFKTSKEYLDKHYMDFSSFYKCNVNLYEFVPNKKYIEELLDTDESDATTLSHDDLGDDGESTQTPASTATVAGITEWIETLLGSVQETQKLNVIFAIIHINKEVKLGIRILVKKIQIKK